MTKPTIQHDFDPRSSEEFRRLCFQELPFWEEVVVRGQRLITALKGILAEQATSVKPRYRIWAQGKCKVVEDISVYKMRKHAFDFWIDLDEKSHLSLKHPNGTLNPQAVDLLIYILERLGKRVSLKQLLKDVWGEELDESLQYRELQYNKIEQQLTKLNNFCGGEFRKHLFSKKFEKGIGLNKSFTNKYFIFERLG